LMCSLIYSLTNHPIDIYHSLTATCYLDDEVDLQRNFGQFLSRTSIMHARRGHPLAFVTKTPLLVLPQGLRFQCLELRSFWPILHYTRANTHTHTKLIHMDIASTKTRPAALHTRTLALPRAWNSTNPSRASYAKKPTHPSSTTTTTTGHAAPGRTAHTLSLRYP
jgi:hypothetical protein